jgi:hypothetical protein
MDEKGIIKKKDIPGYLTQFPGQGNRNEDCDLVIGFDFGTSTTKVVVQSPYHYDRKSFAVPFSSAQENSYLLPSYIYVNPKTGATSLEKCDGFKRYPDLKINLLHKPLKVYQTTETGLEIQYLYLCMAFIAQTLQNIRKFVFNEKYELYRRFNIIWHLNLGIPSGQFSNKKYKYYKLIAIAAWILSRSKALITLPEAEEVFKRVKALQIENDFGIYLDNINIIPEVTAEIQSYVQSNQRKNGLHFVVDIGAWTMDVAGFVLHEKEGEDRYSLLKTKVRRLGSYRCHCARLKEIRKYILQKYKEYKEQYLLWESDFMHSTDHIPSLLEGYLQFDFHGFQESKTRFYSDCYKTIGSVIGEIRKKRDPNSKFWKEGVPLFTCGGGQHVDLYGNVLNEIDSYYQSDAMNLKGFIFEELPFPDNFEAAEKLFYRLAVAYGLSFPKQEFGEIWPETKIKNIGKIEKQLFDESNYVRKEDT